ARREMVLPGGVSECGVEVHRTLFLGELAMSEPHDATSFLVPRPPGNSLLARHTRLVGSVQACCGSDDLGQWLILGDMTGAVAVKLTLALQRIAVGVMIEAIGDLASGSGGCPLDLPEGHPHRVHVRVRHALIHGEASYLERRWRTMRQQRCLEQEALHDTSPVGEAASTLRQINPPPSAHKASVPAPAQHTKNGDTCMRQFSKIWQELLGMGCSTLIFKLLQRNPFSHG
ncbi:MAG: hypothetical protein SGPRY_004113, partial [Prymnesium sp.]